MRRNINRWSVASLGLVFLGLSDPVAADVFTKGQTGLYQGEGRVTGILAGTPVPSRLSSAAIRVRPNSLIIDGALFRLSGDQIRFRYQLQGLTMACEGNFRKSGRVFTAAGTVEVHNAALAAAGVELTGYWSYRLVFDGPRVRQTLGIRFPNPNDPGETIGTISSGATATRVD